MKKKQFFALFILLLVNLLNVYSQDNEIVTQLKQHVYILASDSLEGRGVGSSGISKAREYIENQFKTVGILPYMGKYEYPFEFSVNYATIRGVNIVAVIEGNDPKLKEECIVIGAHYDHLGVQDESGVKVIYNGADDNASGVATMIEVGKLLMKNKSNLKRTVILVAFDGEESGLLGSTQFVSDKVIENKNIKFMFSLDMVGMYSSAEKLEMSGILNLINGKVLVTKSLDTSKIIVSDFNNKLESRTDTYPFGQIGIPAVHITTGEESPYHKPEDDAELLDYEGMYDICEFISTMTLNISNEKELLPIKQFDETIETPKNSKISYGIKAAIGKSFHIYKEDFFNAKPIFAYNAGFYLNIKISKYFFIQPEVNYYSTGSDNFAGFIRTQTVDIPVNLQFSTGNNNGVWAYFLLGGYYNYCFSAKIGSDNLKIGTDYEQNNYGINYGVGLKIQKVGIEFYNKRSLSNILLTNPSGDVFEKAMFFSFSYDF